MLHAKAAQTAVCAAPQQRVTLRRPSAARPLLAASRATASAPSRRTGLQTVALFGGGKGEDKQASGGAPARANTVLRRGHCRRCLPARLGRLPASPPFSFPLAAHVQDAARKALQDAFKGKKDPFAAAEERAKKRSGGGGGGGGEDPRLCTASCP